MRDTWSSALKAAVEVFSAEIDRVLDDFESRLSGKYGSLEDMKEAFD
jgi:hypothetical protein